MALCDAPLLLPTHPLPPDLCGVDGPSNDCSSALSLSEVRVWGVNRACIGGVRGGGGRGAKQRGRAPRFLAPERTFALASIDVQLTAIWEAVQ